MASSLFIDLDGQPIPDSEILGYGRSGVVMLRNGLAVKTPLRHPWSTEDDVQLNVEVIQREQEVYRRLNSTGSGNGQIDGVVPCIGFSTKATQLAYMENGDLRAYLEKNKPSRALQMSWFRQMARTLEQIHDKRVLVADIATRNFLLDSDLSVKLCDFTEASVLPLDTVMELADDNGFSIQTDIGQLGAVMYEVVTGSKCDFDLFKDNAPDDGRAIWPQRTSLPSTNGLWDIETIARSVVRRIPARISRRQNKVDRAAQIYSPIHLPQELQPLLEQWKSLPQKFPLRLPESQDYGQELPVKSPDEFVAKSFLFLCGIERVMIIEKVRCRLCYVAFYLMKDQLQRDGFRQDAIVCLSDMIKRTDMVSAGEHAIQRKLRTWVDKGERLWLLSMDLEGPGVLFLLPEDIGENM
ncbi:putative protein kinase [Aspergillus fischeri NRRL 181]|uniref:Protein kinase, putative n=1 Tax=Neosartorya fischeri (strain ATCC 1020 / DSM 3700 / CBS 544.65 / FGSC A1164 / JCM 1740 / NRRL 181 / WB 181) TaxID=331117 RepID=A1D0T6_NEOFI|nr:protein kinase, putative [Aspergillus fischeri NRRL 181]EAW24606.1 protein kinase, putative [Aspergillus fischeri NRRL 181]KAG2002731.1 hypothetical protein GB937_009604 [Aspergillus fischeri]